MSSFIIDDVPADGIWDVTVTQFTDRNEARAATRSGMDLNFLQGSNANNFANDVVLFAESVAERADALRKQPIVHWIELWDPNRLEEYKRIVVNALKKKNALDLKKIVQFYHIDVGSLSDATSSSIAAAHVK